MRLGTRIELWVDLLKDGQQRANVSLSEIEEGYTVFVLERFLNRADLGSIIIALEYLTSIEGTDAYRYNMLPDAADASLLMAGLFPERAQRLNVSDTYFVDMSSICYNALALACKKLDRPGEAQLYESIGHATRRVARVLYMTRDCTKKEFKLHNNILLQ